MSAPRFRPLSPTSLTEVEDPCEHCGYGFTRRARTDHFGRTEDTVPSWPADVAAVWGNCGVSAHLGATMPGYLTYAPAEMVVAASILAVPADAVFSPDAAVLVSVSVCRDYRGRGIGKELVRTAVAQLIKRQVGMVEVLGTFGAATVLRQAQEPPGTDGDEGLVLLPVAFWHAIGFRIVRPHPLTPTLRLDAAGTVRRGPDFAAAWHRITDLVKAPGPAQPASFIDGAPAVPHPEQQLIRSA